ncbi:malto-oligosyltrehalose synthase [Dongia deserti]|uniref:malto-oligosyltrehalose synthase n=1 Tax=Dongia deserti TaxID=2268030 RepID=UPI000E655D81|nr:malto-oligosyltrehalose synthase [Dongia deserti]
MTETNALDQICEELGILPRYRDHAGAIREVPQATLRSLMAYLKGVKSDGLVPPVFVHRQGSGPIAVPLRHADQTLRWEVDICGRTLAGSVAPNATCIVVEDDAPSGYHELKLYSGNALLATCTLIIAPQQAFLPPLLRDGGRLWGLATQLFALRSARNWGIGDFTDLADLAWHAASHGVAAIGLTPLHALFPDEPDRCSPYSPSSRCFLNVLYIDPEAMPEFATCEAAQALRAEPTFDSELARLRSTPLVDYAGVATCKRRMLGLLYEHFRNLHLARNDEHAAQFQRFRKEHGSRLRQFATFEALREHFERLGGSLSWPSWPEPFRDPDSEAVADFVARHEERITYFEYLQWHAHRQLLQSQQAAREAGMPIGIYLDIAVGVDRDSAEAWWSQDYLVGGWSIGAPPDNWNLKGQSWGAPPPNALRMRETAYAAIRECLEANMRAAGAVRIDHILGFMRLFWVPEAADAAAGAYIRYPLDDLLAILALESQAHRCLVIGEDLGTVPDGLHDAMQRTGILSYRLLYFEHEPDGSFRKVTDWPQQALVAPSTHDLSTLPAYWRGADLDLRAKLDLYPSRDVAEAERQRRVVDREQLVAALAEQGLPATVDGDVPIESVYRFLARTPSYLLMVQPEDLLSVIEPMNVPGTTTEYPNWRRKLPVSAVDFFADAKVARVVAAINAEGRESPKETQGPDTVPSVPTATYRLQFNRHFTFADARQLIPYLSELGISHVYASSYLKARPGSAHGYDIIDHNEINPEIGSWSEFEGFCDALREAGIGQILDFIPNHMGIGYADNEFWLDVLEWGPISPFAGFFDINWHPRQPNLKGKVLVPLLGDQYGNVLERGELELRFEAESGSFAIWYFQHRFPIHPRCYHQILGDVDTDLKRLALTVAEVNEAAMRSVGDKLKQDLASFARADPEHTPQIENAIKSFQGEPGNPESFRPLHDLLEQQAYRLAFWRVAADEINYRRFFDINELAGIRMENPEVFAHAHRLVGQLTAEGRLHGLRLDHVDGLLDPGGYIAQLRDFAAHRSKDFYIVVEKILARHERLRTDWPIAGTTGYDFTNLVNGLFVDPDGKQAMDRTYRRFLDRSADFDEILYACKLQVIDTMLASELNRLASGLDAISERHWSTRDYTEERLRAALREVVACFPVYRSYVTERGVSPDDRRDIDWAIGQARKSYAGPDPEILDFIRAALATDLADWSPAFNRDEILRFAMRFQQYTGPVTAKALEDTSFYRYNRLLSLNEVGGDPRQFGVTLSAFHHLMQERAKSWPNAMSALATHDTKRGADLRARLNILSEIAPEWNQRVRRWATLNRFKRGKVGGDPAPSPNDEYAIYQTLLGAWPVQLLGVTAPTQAELEVFRERMKGAVLKSIREAKRRTSWSNPNEAYEAACLRFVERLLETDRPNPFLDDFVTFQRRVAQLGALNSLSQTVVTLTAPGVPDLYQGGDLWDLNMVDPDNRRPVDFELRQRMLADITQPDADRRAQVRNWLANWPDGRVKLAVASAVLRCRRQHADLFRQGTYEPIAVNDSQHMIAFARRDGNRSCLVIAGRLFARLMQDASSYDGAELWADLRIEAQGMPEILTNVLTGQIHLSGDGLQMGEVLADLPVAVLLGHN